MPTHQKPLSHFSVLTTTQLDKGREHLSRIYCNHTLDLTYPRQHLNMEIHHAPLINLSMVFASHGADVKIIVGEPQTFFAIQLALSGKAEYRNGKKQIECSGEIGYMISPTRDLKIRCSEDSGVLGVTISRQALEVQLQNWLGMPLSEPLEFDGRIDFRGRPLVTLSHLIRFYVKEIDRNPTVLHSSLAVKNFEHSVMTQLLRSQPHNYTNFLNCVHTSASPHQVNLIEAYLDSHVEGAFKLQNLVELTGHSASSIYHAFQRYRGYTPLAFLTNRRMEGLRKSLENADPNATVTKLAGDWGFTHLGRLSVDYKKIFGESPSETLRKLKRSQN